MQAAETFVNNNSALIANCEAGDATEQAKYEELSLAIAQQIAAEHDCNETDVCSDFDYYVNKLFTEM